LEVSFIARALHAPAGQFENSLRLDLKRGTF
jgi:hypothetical protein